MAENPYAAPQARVEDQVTQVGGKLLDEPRLVAAGQGWTWIVEGFNLFKKQPGLWIGIIVVLGIITIVLQIIPIVGPLAMSLLMPVFVAGLMLGCRTLDQGGELQFGALFSGFSVNTGRLIGLGAIALGAMLVVMLVIFLIAGASIFMSASGGGGGGPNPATLVLAMLVALALMLPIYMALWFSPALIALDDQPLGEAIKKSFFACLKNILPFLVYGVVLFVLFVIAMIPLGLGLLVAGPLAIGSVYASYRDLFFER